MQTRPFWFIAFADRVPDVITEGVYCGEDEAKPEELTYALLCRAASESELAARGLVVEWLSARPSRQNLLY